MPVVKKLMKDPDRSVRSQARGHWRNLVEINQKVNQEVNQK